MEKWIERRIHYSYGVNSGTHTNFASYEWLQRDIEERTMGPVNVDKRESRVVTFHDWQEEEK